MVICEELTNNIFLVAFILYTFTFMSITQQST